MANTLLWQVNSYVSAIFTQEAECIRASNWQVRVDNPVWKQFYIIHIHE